MNEKLKIKEWAEEDRPREKLMKMGAEALSNAELLAILIGSGSQNESAVDLMKRILNACDNNLNTLGKMSIKELTDKNYKGMGPAKAIAVLAACELGKRRQREEVKERKKLNSAEAIYQYMRPQMMDMDHEEAWAILMNQNFRLITNEPLSQGGWTETSVDVRELLKKAILNNATIIALCHNHPSGNPLPSKDDDRLTDRIKKACEVMRIHFLDHIIVTDGRYYSYSEMGRI
ncbi:MAG: DNA repair protein RadC [Prevotella sp.]|nr:DNA repair protein RadC [Prevotella sp.]